MKTEWTLITFLNMRFQGICANGTSQTPLCCASKFHHWCLFLMSLGVWNLKTSEPLSQMNQPGPITSRSASRPLLFSRNFASAFIGLILSGFQPMKIGFTISADSAYLTLKSLWEYLKAIDNDVSAGKILSSQLPQ